MAAITAALVKELRERTGAGMMDCKKALGETDGDLEAGVDWLRKKGLAAAAKKAGRAAAEGLVGMLLAGNEGALVEINSETDFVARNDAFQKLLNDVTAVAPQAKGDIEALRKVGLPNGKAVEDEVTSVLAVIGENINLRRTAWLSVENGVVGGYVHAQTSPGQGKIGVLVAIESTGDKDRLAELGKQLAMHIAAANPQAVSTDRLDPEVVERERKVLADQARASGKPENIIEKMLEGRMRKFYEESVLLEQVFIMDTDKRVKDVVAELAKELGTPVTVADFVRMQVGEGVEKKEDDLAAEVAKLTA